MRILLPAEEVSQVVGRVLGAHQYVAFDTEDLVSFEARDTLRGGLLLDVALELGLYALNEAYKVKVPA